MRRILQMLLVAGLAAGTASAQLIVNPVGKAPVGGIEVGGAAGFSSIEYDGDGDVDRTMLGAYGAFGVCEMADVYGSLAYSFKSEPDGSDEDGSGYFVSGGARAKVFTQDKLSVFAYAFLQYGSETYEVGRYDVDVSIIELGGGALAAYQVMPELLAYGGLELVPFSSGDAEVDGHESDGDVERDGMISLRGGATFNLGNFWVRGELAIGSETAIMAGAGVSL